MPGDAPRSRCALNAQHLAGVIEEAGYKLDGIKELLLSLTTSDEQIPQSVMVILADAVIGVEKRLTCAIADWSAEDEADAPTDVMPPRLQ